MYALSFSKALESKSSYGMMKTQIENYSIVDDKLLAAEKRLDAVGVLYNSKGDSLQSFEAALLQFIGLNRSSSKLEIIQFNRPFLYEESGNLIETIEFQLKGAYQNQIDLLNKIETLFPGAKVTSSHFLKKENLKKGKEELIQTIYVQRISKK